LHPSFFYFAASRLRVKSFSKLWKPQLQHQRGFAVFFFGFTRRREGAKGSSIQLFSL
jgi:hypothetical protein